MVNPTLRDILALAKDGTKLCGLELVKFRGVGNHKEMNWRIAPSIIQRFCGTDSVMLMRIREGGTSDLNVAEFVRHIEREYAIIDEHNVKYKGLRTQPYYIEDARNSVLDCRYHDPKNNRSASFEIVSLAIDHGCLYLEFDLGDTESDC